MQSPTLSIERMFSVKDKVVFVTGGSKGIGQMMASALVENGAHVIICSRKKQAVDAAVEKMNTLGGRGSCVGFTADLSSLAECERAAAEVEKLVLEIQRKVLPEHASSAARLDVLINNSGIAWGAPIEQFDDRAWDRVLNLNVKGLFYVTRFCLPMLERAATSESPARVINIGSIAGLRNQLLPTYSYDASKAAVHHLTRHLAAHLAPRNICVNCVAPGFVKSSMSDQILTYASLDAITSSIPRGRIGGDLDMGGVAVYLSSPASSWVTGVVIPVDGGALVFQAPRARM